MTALAAIVLCLGGSVCVLNFYLYFLRCPVHRWKGGRTEEFRWVSGIPLIGSALVALSLLKFYAEPWLLAIGLLLIALDSGGVHWFLGMLFYQKLLDKSRTSREAPPDEKDPKAMKTVFTKLNKGWNAEPNAPKPTVGVRGTDVVLSFLLNPFQFPEYKEGDIGTLRFEGCWRYRIGQTNDEGWYRGQCRFSSHAPAWGEFYEIQGDLKLDECPDDWVTIGLRAPESRHFLFYFRDNTFECDATDWRFGQ